VDFRILGPLEVHGDRGAIDVPGGRQRALLAVLLLNANKPVSAERIAVALWGEDAPPGAAKTVQVYVSRLRKALGDGALLSTTGASYQLAVQPGELDAERFENLVADGRRALKHGRAGEAATILRKALKLWRGQPLHDFVTEAWAQVEIARLEEEQQAAQEARVEADLAVGRHAEIVAELGRMVAAHPMRERLAGHLMLALYRCGRQAEALEAYREARKRLVDTLGLEPGDELSALHEAILRHDPALAMEAAATLPPELDLAAAPPLVGRESELEWLRSRWQEARAGVGRVVVVAGDHGMGKLRLVAELTVEVHMDGNTVLYASGAYPAQAVFDVLDRMASARRPLLLVVEDADEAGEPVLEAIRDAGGGATLIIATARMHEKLAVLEPGDVVHLPQLDSGAVAQIAALYAPDPATREIPAERLFNESGGVPRRIHEVARVWARSEAARRVGAVAGRAAAGRSELRSMEDELAGGVVQMQVLHEWRGTGGNGAEQIVCPFKGLASFDVADAEYFFGREQLVAELVTRLVGANLLSVVGPSGSGKSSVVRAGLLPALTNGVLPGRKHWPQRVIRPGEHPLRQLDRALDEVGSERFVLAVDQFEEAFTACQDETERRRFFAELAAATDGLIILVVRADFYGRCSQYPELSHVLDTNEHVFVGPMQRLELQRAVICPAERVGLAVEPELVEALVDDVKDAPGALPLLSTALLELWRDRDGRRLQLSAYERTGGVRGAVARLGEETFSHLDAGQRELARKLLVKLVALDENGAFERRRRHRDELGAREDVTQLLDVLADRRLVTISEGTVELAHEALLREWPRLRAWIEDEGEGLRIERSLRTAAREWLRVGRDDGALYRGARLDEASEWAGRNGHALPQPEHEFLAASQTRATRDRRARRRGLTLAFGALAVGLVAIAIIAGVAIDQRQTAERERDVATSRELAAQAQKNIVVDPALALRLALSALDTERTPQAAAALREATAAFRQRAALRADPADAWAAQVSPDGRHIVTAGGDGTAILWDATTHDEIRRWDAKHHGVFAARFGPDGDIVLGLGDGTVAVTDPELGSPDELAHLKHTAVLSTAFTGDGDHIVTGSDDGKVRVFAIANPAQPQVLTGHTDSVNSVDASPDGALVASASSDGSVRLWTLADGTGQVLHDGDATMWDVAFSPDGKWLLAVGDDGFVHRWNVATRREGARTEGTGSPLYTVAFSTDGRRFAAGGEDGNVLVWTEAGAPPIATLRGQGSWVYDVGFGDSGEVVTALDDGTARVWNAGTMELWTVPKSKGGMEFNADGRLLVTTSLAGPVSVWDATSGQLVSRLPESSDSITVEFSPTDDAVLLADGYSPNIRTWPVHERRARLLFRAPKASGVATARYDSRGERIVYADTDGRLAVRSLNTQEEVTLRGGPKDIYDAQFSDDGQRVAVISESGLSAVWNIEHPDRPLHLLKGHRGHENAMDFAADDRVVTAGSDKTIRVWPADGGRAIVMTGHTLSASDASFTADGSKVLSSGFDGTVRLWDSATGVPLAVIETSPRALYSLRVSSDGKVATLDAGGVLRVFKCEVCGPLGQVEDQARSLSPRQLSPDERRRYLDAG
jgi:WD40 repeat protein/DNA-binding SARP family transcriptional activator